MGEILSHAEVEAILSSVEPFSRFRQPLQAPDQQSAEATSVWEQHDFRRPAPLRGTALKIIRALHSGMGLHSKTRLETMLQTRVEIQPVGTGQTTPAEFLATLRPPCTVCQFGRPDSEPSFFLVWSTQLLQSLYSRILGGQDRGSSNSAPHPITSIERRLLSKLNDLLLLDLSGLLNTEFTVGSIYESHSSGPQPISTGSSIWLSFEMGCGSERGLIHLGIPQAEFNSKTYSSATNSTFDGNEYSLVAQSLPPGIQKVTVDVSATLATLRMRTSDVAALEVGDMIMTDLHKTEAITVRLDDQDLCRAAIGTHSGQRALRLIQSPNQRNRNTDGYTPRGPE